LPNVPWLEMKIPPFLEQLKEDNPDAKTFFVVFSMMSNAVMTKNNGHEIIKNQFNALADGLKISEPVIFRAAGIDVGHLICFCRSESAEKLSDWAAKIIEKYTYMGTANANTKIAIHMKAGISSYDESLDIQQTIGRAVTACQQISGGEVKLFDEKMEEALTTQHEIENRMVDALKNDEFKAWYQPKYDIKTRRIVGAEALVRWISPVTGFMPPGKFIPLFEQNGFVIQVDYYILEKTCQLQRERLDAGKEVVPISVNQSRLHMTEDGYLEKMRAVVEKYKLPPNLIELEVTETMFGDFDKKSSRQNAEKIINSLKEMGFTISVDDFGAGYSSFSLLSILPMDVLKIDRSVLTGADSSIKMKTILGKVIELGNSLGMKVICEGIETVEEENLLLRLGCRYGQGFFNAKPMPVNDFISFFEKRNAEVAAGA
ncbi:MAG: EAL domain-containing protein, partial [Selenomonadaceae bacterium]|nr:EAL domain-containing protein [Selenomonadaceae bacterium]